MHYILNAFKLVIGLFYLIYCLTPTYVYLEYILSFNEAAAVVVIYTSNGVACLPSRTAPVATRRKALGKAKYSALCIRWVRDSSVSLVNIGTADCTIMEPVSTP